MFILIPIINKKNTHINLHVFSFVLLTKYILYNRNQVVINLSVSDLYVFFFIRIHCFFCLHGTYVYLLMRNMLVDTAWSRICWWTPPGAEFAQYHYKIVSICRNTLRPLFYSFLVFAKREGGGNVVYTLVFNLWLFTDFRWGLGQGHGWPAMEKKLMLLLPMPVAHKHVPGAPLI